MNRRGFLGGLLAAAVAPAIIRTPGLIMPIKPALVPVPVFSYEPIWKIEINIEAILKAFDEAHGIPPQWLKQVPA